MSEGPIVVGTVLFAPRAPGEPPPAFPPFGLDEFVADVHEQEIGDVVVTGLGTDPQRARHEPVLVDLLRERTRGRVRLTLHTDGSAALERIAVLDLYDRVSVSVPSLDPAHAERETGRREWPDLAAIVARARVPVTVACDVPDDQQGEIPTFLERCLAMGVRRVLLRKPRGASRIWRHPVDGLVLVCTHRGRSVYGYSGMQVLFGDRDLWAGSTLCVADDVDMRHPPGA